MPISKEHIARLHRPVSFQPPTRVSRTRANARTGPTRRTCAAHGSLYVSLYVCTYVCRTLQYDKTSSSLARVTPTYARRRSSRRSASILVGRILSCTWRAVTRGRSHVEGGHTRAVTRGGRSQTCHLIYGLASSQRSHCSGRWGARWSRSRGAGHRACPCRAPGSCTTCTRGGRPPHGCRC
jgi:hypothetical protein